MDPVAFETFAADIEKCHVEYFVLRIQIQPSIYY